MENTEKMAQQQPDPNNKADNQSVYDQPTIQKKTNEGDAEKCETEAGSSYSNTIKQEPHKESTNGVNKV
jgi:hypothetical protein